MSGRHHRKGVDWDAFFARPGSREMSAPEIGRRMGVRREHAREAAKRRGIVLPHGKPGSGPLPPWTAEANAVLRKRIRNRLPNRTVTDHEAVMLGLAALQAVPRYDARAA